MSYRAKPEIYGDLHSSEAKPGQNFAIMGACLGIVLPGFGRMLANSGWFADRDLLISSSIVAAFVCIIGGVVAGTLARRKARSDIEDMIHG